MTTYGPYTKWFRKTICHRSRSCLVVISERFTAIRYNINALKSVLDSFLHKVNDHIFQQDNAKSRTANTTIEFLHTVNIDMLC